MHVADFLHHDLNDDRVHDVLHSSTDGMGVALKVLQEHFERLIVTPGAMILVAPVVNSIMTGETICRGFKLCAVMPLLNGPQAALSCKVRSTFTDGSGASGSVMSSNQLTQRLMFRYDHLSGL